MYICSNNDKKKRKNKMKESNEHKKRKKKRRNELRVKWEIEAQRNTARRRPISDSLVCSCERFISKRKQSTVFQ